MLPARTRLPRVWELPRERATPERGRPEQRHDPERSDREQRPECRSKAASVSARESHGAALDTAATRACERLLTADELAERWQVKKSVVYRLTREGALPAVRIGRYCRYRLAAVEAWEVDGGGSG